MGIYLIPPSPKAYLLQAVDIMDRNGLYSNTPEWEQMKRTTTQQASSIHSYEEAHALIKKALKVSGGKHSMLEIINGAEAVDAPIPKMPQASMDEDGIITLVIPMILFNAGSSQQYVETIIEALRKEKDHIQGVIVDLRGNTGGDMGPMVAALSPLLPDGELMYFSICGRSNPVVLRKGAVMGGGSTINVSNPFKLEGVPVALLQDDQTSSSGEATLLTFRGLEGARTFGQSSAGYCSCNMTYRLYDGAEMTLTVGEDVARSGERFCENPILPDVETSDPMHEAHSWLVERIKGGKQF